MRITIKQLRTVIKEEVQKLAEHWEDGDDGYGDMDFADPGGRSSLRAGVRNKPCPTCHQPNALTAKDVRLGYQCDDCADRQESGRDWEG